MAYTPAQREVNTSSWNRRETPPHLSSKDEKWDHLLGKVDFWSMAARKNKEETVRVRQQLSALQTDITDCYHRSDDVLNAFQDIRGGIEELRAQDKGRDTVQHSPRALASQALYAERGSVEGTAEYQRRRSAQARFETSRPSVDSRAEQVEEYSSSPYSRAGEQSKSLRRYARQMAESNARVAWKRSHGRTNIGGPYAEPSDSSSDESAEDDR